MDPNQSFLILLCMVVEKGYRSNNPYRTVRIAYSVEGVRQAIKSIETGEVLVKLLEGQPLEKDLIEIFLMNRGDKNKDYAWVMNFFTIKTFEEWVKENNL